MCSSIYVSPFDATLFASVLLPLSILLYFFLTHYQVSKKQSTLVAVVVSLILYIIVINTVIYFVLDLSWSQQVGFDVYC